jgi:hypothetical protein
MSLLYYIQIDIIIMFLVKVPDFILDSFRTDNLSPIQLELNFIKSVLLRNNLVYYLNKNNKDQQNKT